MHMADALISPAVGGAAWAATAGLTVYSARKLKQEMDDRKLPLMGVLGAFVFAAQMINFTIPATGSSGHLGGGIAHLGRPVECVRFEQEDGIRPAFVLPVLQREVSASAVQLIEGRLECFARLRVRRRERHRRTRRVTRWCGGAVKRGWRR